MWRGSHTSHLPAHSPFSFHVYWSSQCDSTKLLSLCCGLSSRTWRYFSSSGSQSSLRNSWMHWALTSGIIEHKAFHNYVYSIWVPQTPNVKPILRPHLRAWNWRVVDNRQVYLLHPLWLIFYITLEASIAAMCSSASICPISTSHLNIRAAPAAWVVMPMLGLAELTAHSHPARPGWKIMSGIGGDRGVQRISHTFSFTCLEVPN